MKTLGKHPAAAARMKGLENSPNYKYGDFQNIHSTPMARNWKSSETIVQDAVLRLGAIGYDTKSLVLVPNQ